MKIEIEEYKGQTIYYDDASDKFVCDIEIDGNVKNGKRGSLVDLRKEIDSFIKLNLNFKPFEIFYKRYDEFIKTTVKAIRTDGKLIMDLGNYSPLIGKNEEKNIFKYDAELQKQFDEAKAKHEQFYKEFIGVKKQIEKQLVPMDLSKYDLK